MGTMEKFKISNFVKALAFYFFLLPLGALNINSNIGSALKLVALLPLIVFVLSQSKIVFTKTIKWQLFFAFWTMISCLWAINSKIAIERSITQFLLIFLLIPVSSMRYNCKELDFLRKSLVYSSRFTAIILLLFSSYFEGRLYLSGIISEDPNYLCAYFLFGIIYCISKLYKKKKFIIFNIVELLIYIYIIILTGSRGGLLAVIIAAIVFVLFKDNFDGKRINIKKNIAISFLILAVFAVVWSLIPSDIKARFVFNKIVQSNGTGRFDIWRNGITLFVNNGPFRRIFGCGTGCIREYFSKYGYVDKVMHNIFLENLLEIGIVGLLIYILSIFSFLKSAILSKDLFSASILTGMIVLSLSTSLYAFKPYWNILIFIVCLARIEEKHEV